MRVLCGKLNRAEEDGFREEGYLCEIILPHPEYEKSWSMCRDVALLLTNLNFNWKIRGFGESVFWSKEWHRMFRGRLCAPFQQDNRIEFWRKQQIVLIVLSHFFVTFQRNAIVQSFNILRFQLRKTKTKL